MSWLSRRGRIRTCRDGENRPFQKGGPGKDIKVHMSDSQQRLQVLEFQMREGKEVWKGKEGSTRDTIKIDLDFLVNERSLRLLDGGVRWAKPATYHMMPH